MKYFTSKWWSAGCNPEVFMQYHEYFLSISSKLPAELCIFYQEHTLHDSKIESINSNFSNNTISIILNGWDSDLNYPVKYELSFKGVISFIQNLPLEDNRFGDLGYCEYDIIDSNTEMRMLFDSDAQINIIFNNFEFKSKPRKP